MFTLLTATAGLGILSVLFLFALCFVGVHLVLLARLGLLYRQEEESEQAVADAEKKQEEPEKNTPEKNAPEKPTQNPAPEPIYYIVEKKRKTKASYSAPKQIKFK